MITETIEKLEMDDELITFNGPDDDSDDFDDDAFDLGIETIVDFGGFDDIDDDF